MPLQVVIFSALMLGMMLSASADPNPFLFGNSKRGPQKALKVEVKYDDCSSSELLKINNINVNITGNIVIVDASFSITRDVDAMALDVELKLQGFIRVPCDNGIGSCHYNNICDKLNQNKESCLKEMNSRNLTLPCQCPIPKGDYTLQKMQFTIPSNFKSFLTGTHTAKLIGSIGGQEVLCYTIRVRFYT